MAFEKFNLTGKTALITGAGGLLGLEHAYALLESGASIVLTDISDEVLESAVERLAAAKTERSKITCQKMDVSQPRSIKAAAEMLWRSGIRVDILINNAAIDPKAKGNEGLTGLSRLENLTLDQWNLEVAVGLTGAFLCSQTFGTAMSEDGKGGIILNIASDLSVFSPDQRLYRNSDLPGHSQPVKPLTYSVIKTGLIGLTRYISTYWADRGVRCNAISPGGVLNGQSEEFVSRVSELIPMGRMAAREEYRSIVQLLCSDASSYLNGQNIVVDGGRSVW